MLNDIKEEKFLFVFFAVTLIVMLYLSISKKDILDISYLVVVIYYFIKFIIKSRIDNYTRG